MTAKLQKQMKQNSLDVKDLLVLYTSENKLQILMKLQCQNQINFWFEAMLQIEKKKNLWKINPPVDRH